MLFQLYTVCSDLWVKVGFFFVSYSVFRDVFVFFNTQTFL